jgi:hypothetical protein
MPLENLINKKDQKGLGSLIKKTKSPYAMSEEEAIQYALKMGFTDSWRGIQQIYGEITNSDDLLEKLSAKDKKLDEIFKNPEYGDKAMGFYLGAAIGGDPIGYVPFLGWGKKINGIGKATAFGTGMGAFQSGIAYQSEGMDRGESALTGATIGGILGLGGSGLIQAMAKAKGAKPAKFARTTKQRQEDIIEEQANLVKAGQAISSEKEIEELTRKTLEEYKKNPKKTLSSDIEKFWAENVGDKVWDLVGKNWGSALAGTFGSVAGYNAWNDPESTEAEKMFAAFLMGAGGIGVTKLGGQIPVGDIKLKELMAKGLVDNYGLPKEYLALKRGTFGEVNALATKFAEASTLISTLPAKERKIINAMITGDLDSLANKDFVGFSQKSRDIIDKTGQELVDAGLLSEKVYRKNQGKYLHRTYEKHLKGEAPQEAVRGARYLKIIGDELRPRGYSKTIDQKTYLREIDNYKEWEVVDEFTVGKGKKQKTRVTLRRDLTKAERKARGEIEDAAFNVAETGRVMTNDLAVYKLYSNVSKNNNFALDEKIFKEKLLAGELREQDWLQMPDTIVRGLKFGKNPVKTYGQLANKFVPKEIHDDLVKINAFKEKETKNVFDAYLDINRFWKKSKTAWNPTVHVNNTISNVLLMDFAGGSYKAIPKGYSELLKGLDGDPKATMYKLAKEYGVFDVDLVSKELTGETRDALQKTLRELADEGSLELKNATEYSKNIYQRLAEKGYEMTAGKLEKFYQLEDQVFRMALFIDRLEKGFDVNKAAADAKKWFIDYDINAPFIDFMRRAPTPFISYTYRVVPLLAEAAVYRPWKFAKWAAIGYGMNEVGKGKIPFAEAISEDPDFGRIKEEIGNEEAERLLMRKNMQDKFFGLPFMPETLIKTPFASGISERKGEEVIDVKRFIPGGDVLNVGDKGFGIPLDFLGFKDKQIDLPTVLSPNFGAAGEIMIPILTGVDPFTKQKIDGLGLGNDGAVLTQHILNRLIPNIPASAFTIPFIDFETAEELSQKIQEAFRQAKDGAQEKFGTEFTPFEAILSTFGFKLTPVEVEKLLGIKSQEFRTQYSQMRQAIYRIQRNIVERKISKEAGEKQINDLIEKIETLANRLELTEKRFRELKRTGGLVSDVEEDPVDRKNPYTGVSYADTADVFTQMEKALKEMQEETEKVAPIDKQMSQLRTNFFEGTTPDMINFKFLNDWHEKNFTDVDEFKGTLDKQLKGKTVSMRLNTFEIDGKNYILPTYAKGIGRILADETFKQDIKDGKIIGYETKEEAEKQLRFLRNKIINKQKL